MFVFVYVRVFMFRWELNELILLRGSGILVKKNIGR